MKFGHVFSERLKSEGFPPEWVEAAISYRQLKKCIHRLTDELAQVGLDSEILGKLLKHVEDYNAAAVESEDGDIKPFEYIFSSEPLEGGTSASKSRRQPFHPKLLFYIDEGTGTLHDAKLDQETKEKLQQLAVATGMSELRVTEEPVPDERNVKSTTTPDLQDGSANEGNNKPKHRVIEIPLTSDIEFFNKLTDELSGLEALQKKEEEKLNAQIEELGKRIAIFTDPNIHKNKKILGIWRNVFQIYVESDIFFGTTEVDHKAHTADQAKEKFQKFSILIVDQGLVSKLKKREGLQALNAFMQINREIIHSLQFGEINKMAMTKILKSKQTQKFSTPSKNPC